jgi:hypothetical protein
VSDAGLSSEESADRRLGVGHLVVRQPLVRPIGSVEDQFSSPWLFGQLCAFQFRRVTDSTCLLLVSASQVEVSSEKDNLCMIELEHVFPSKFKDLVHESIVYSFIKAIISSAGLSPFHCICRTKTNDVYQRSQRIGKQEMASSTSGLKCQFRPHLFSRMLSYSLAIFHLYGLGISPRSIF